MARKHTPKAPAKRAPRAAPPERPTPPAVDVEAFVRETIAKELARLDVERIEHARARFRGANASPASPFRHRPSTLKRSVQVRISDEEFNVYVGLMQNDELWEGESMSLYGVLRRLAWHGAEALGILAEHRRRAVEIAAPTGTRAARW